MENMCHKIATSVGAKLNYDDEQIAVVSYGLIAISQTLILFIFSSIVGIIFNCWLECFTILFSAGLLRQYTGGVHSQTLWGCIAIALTVIGSFGAISRFAFIDLYNNLVDMDVHYIILLCMIPIYIFLIIKISILAPVDTPNKPIRKPEKIKRLNSYSIIVISLYFFLSALFFALARIHITFLTVSISLLLASIWQTFTLTKIGHKVIHIVDFIKPRP